MGALGDTYQNFPKNDKMEVWFASSDIFCRPTEKRIPYYFVSGH